MTRVFFKANQNSDDKHAAGEMPAACFALSNSAALRYRNQQLLPNANIRVGQPIERHDRFHRRPVTARKREQGVTGLDDMGDIFG
jgi:hypothetical protein